MSKPPRFFITPDQVQTRIITVTGEDVRHIRTVLRKKPGDLLVLSDGRGIDYTTRIVEVTPSGIKTEITSEARRPARELRIILAQALPKSDKMELILQKATELGAERIVPVITERSILKIRNEQTRSERWRKICREAAMQSERPDIPSIDSIQTVADFLQSLTRKEFSLPETLLIMPWEQGSEPIKNILRMHIPIKKIIALIGPEGGFSPAEVELAKNSGFHPVTLGKNILRTETAAIAVLSMISYEYL